MLIVVSLLDWIEFRRYVAVAVVMRILPIVDVLHAAQSRASTMVLWIRTSSQPGLAQVLAVD